MIRSLFQKYYQRSFFNKLLLVFSLITIGSIFILTEVILYSFTQTLENRELGLNSQIIRRTSAYIDRKHRSALTLYQRLYTANEAVGQRPLDFFSAAGSPRSKVNLSTALIQGFQLDSDIHDILFQRYSDGQWYSTEAGQPVLRELPGSVALTLPRGQASGFTLLGAHMPLYGNNPQGQSRPRVYTMGATVMNADLSQRVGELYIEFRADRVRTDFQEYVGTLKGFILVLTESGDVLFDSSDRYYGEKYPWFDRLEGSSHDVMLDVDSVVNVVRSQSGAVVAGIIPRREVYTVSATIRRTVYLVSLACLLAALGLSYLSTSVTSRRVRAVTEAMKRLRGGDLAARIDVGPQPDELGQIAESFNRMGAELQSYINKVYLAEVQQKSAQMKALQSQINPHFLYNTLEAIRMRAITSGDEDAGEMIRLLAALFRSSIRDEMVIDVREETRLCNLYLELFRIRFGDRLSARVQVSDEALACGVLKHLLQPAIENYVVHGFQSDRDDNRIAVTGCVEGQALVFVIEDNGVGIEPERLNVLRESLRGDGAGESIGLPNVNERIRLVYGEPYGLQIDSRQGQGSTVTIRVRALDREELKRFVHSADR